MDDQFLPPKPSDNQLPENMPGSVIMPGSQPPKPDPSFEEYHDPNEPEPPADPVNSVPEQSKADVPPQPQEEPPEPPAPPSPEAGNPPVPEADFQPPASQFAHPGIAIPEEVDDTPAPQLKKRLRLWVLLLVAFIVVAGAGTAAFLILGKKPAKKSDTATQPVQNDVPLIRYGAVEGTMNQFAPALSTDPGTLYLNKQIFEPLVGYSSGAKIDSLLVSGWTQPDATTWVFNLKSGIRFHTGNTMTSQDVVYSWQQYKKNPAYAEQFATIKNVEAPAADQVKVTTNGTDPLLLNRLANLLIIDSSAAGKVDPVYGTGPYQLKPGTTPDADRIDLVAFDNFHGGHIYTKEVQFSVYRVVPSQAVTGQAAAFSDLKAGKLDLIGALDGNVFSDASQQSNLTLLPIEYPPVYYIIPNTLKKGSPMASQKVRQAIYETLDVDAILKAQNILGIPQSQLVTKFIPGYNDAISRPDRNIDDAGRLMRDAGYANGTSFTLTLPLSFMPAGNEIARQLKAVNITVKLDPQADAGKVQSDGAAGKLEAYWGVDSSVYNDASDVYARELQSKNYANAHINTLLAQAGATLNQTDRLNFLQQAIKAGTDDTAVIPLYYSRQAWSTSNKSLVMNQDLLKTDYGIYFYKVYSK